jgi:hypothetical protein
MCLTFVAGFYASVLMAILAALITSGIVFLYVGWAHCRNQYLAAAVGLLSGWTMYFGFYYFRMIDQAAPGVAVGLADLPDYIVFSMRTSVIRAFGDRAKAGQPQRPFVLGNWIAFAVEFGFATILPTAAGWRRAGYAYSRELETWMRRETAMLPPLCGPAVRELLLDGDLDHFVDTYIVRGPDGLVEATKGPTVKTAQTACKLIVEYAAPDDNAVLSHAVYVSVDDRPRPKPWYLHKNARRVMLRQLKLETQEVLTISPLFPKLGGMLASGYEELRDLPLASPPALAGTWDVAEITPVPEPYRNRVRSRWYTLVVNLIGALPVVFMFGGMGLAVAGLALVNSVHVALTVVLLGVGAVCLAWGMYTGLFCLAVYENRWIERRLRRQIANRPDALASPDDPEVIYVSLIPREHFLKVKLVMSTDLLLLAIDEVEGAVLLEGDTDRYRIPSGAIADVQPECFFHPTDRQHRNQLWMARLAIQTAGGIRELLLSTNSTSFRPHTNATRRARVEDLCERINALTEPLIEA